MKPMLIVNENRLFWNAYTMNSIPETKATKTEMKPASEIRSVFLLRNLYVITTIAIDQKKSNTPRR